jgi:hypothetical protein
MFERSILVAGACLAAVASAIAQDDSRDRVQKTDGRELRGRVFSRFDGDEIVLQQGTHRTSIPRADVTAIDAVRERVGECMQHFDRLPDHPRHLWYVIGHAQNRQLSDLARVLALDLVLRHPDHAEARAFLGHRRRGKDWLWPDGDEWRSLSDLERRHAEWGHPFVVDSEHFRLRTDASLRRAVDTLLDLERIYQWWLSRFGEPLHLYELRGDKVLFEVWRERGSFPRLNKLEHPYFQHRIEDTHPPIARTYFDGAAGRPTRLTEVAVQALLYRTLADDPGLRTAHRFCGWGEVGLARHAERCLAGPPGRIAPVDWRLPLDEAALVAADPAGRLANLTHRSTRQLHFTVTDEVATDWATVHLFVTFLLTSEPPSGLGQGFLDYLRAAVRGAKGDSSSELDRALGRKLETLEAPFREWLGLAIEREKALPPAR